MKTFLIILGIIVGAIIIFRLFRFLAGNAVNNNPVDSITPYGTLGFKLGASLDVVVSKIKGQKLASKEELDEFEEDLKFQREIGGDKHGLPIYFTCAGNLFGHIKNMCFVFKNNKLAQISVLFDKHPEEIPSFMDVVEYRVSQRLGKPSFKGQNIVKWGDDISIYASLDAKEDKDKVMNLYIGLTNLF